MLRLVSLLACAAPALQSDLTELRDTSLPGSGAASALSGDGDTLFVAQGASIAKIDVDQVRDWIVAGYPAQNLEEVTGDVHPLEASILDIVDDGDDLYVAGGDFGILQIDGTGEVIPIDEQSFGRWCFDLELVDDDPHLYLVSIWGGLNRTQLRVHDLSTGASLERQVNVNIANGLQVAATGYAVEVHEDYAYLAMGSAGLVRVRWRPDEPTTLEQGPDFYTGGGCDSTYSNDQCERQYRVRDIAIAGRYLYAAAEREGLVEIDLTDPWGPDVETWSEQTLSLHLQCSPFSDQSFAFPLRVDAVLDEDQGVDPARVVIAVGASHRPSATTEWGPFYPYTGFTWRLETPDDAGDHLLSCADTSLFVYDRRVNGPPPSLVAALEVDRRWKTLSIQKADERYWIYNNEFRVWHMERDASGALGPIVAEPAETYATPHVAYSGPALGLGDPGLVLCGKDGGATQQMYRVDDSGADPALVPVPGTVDPAFVLSITVGAQWWQAGPSSDWEWLAAGGWKVARFENDPADPDSFVSTWQHWFIDRQDDPLHAGHDGRSYAAHAADYRSDQGVLALGISEIPRAVSLYRRDEILMDVQGADPPSLGENLHVTPLGFLNIHPEVGCDPSEQEFGDFHCFELKIFPWSDGGTERAVLVHAAGYDVERDHELTTFQHPKLVFVDLEDCAAPNYDCSALFDATQPCGSFDPSLMRIVYLPDRYGMAFAVDIATIAGRQYAFVCDTASRVTAYELDDLFGSGPVLRGSWRMPASTFDGLREVLTDILVVFEGASGGPGALPKAYVCATRGGVQKLAIVAAANGDITFTPEGRVNTPGQASKLAIREIDLGGPAPVLRMVVADHDEYGLKLYGE